MAPDLRTLSVENVLRIHEVLVADFASTGDPIGGMGLRSLSLLESAVYRQHAAHGHTLKYPDPVGNAATLVFGICCDHPFVNGNKRTALVALLVHLDLNNLCLYRTSQNDLYSLMLAIAGHTVGVRPEPRRASKKLTARRGADEEVAAIRSWLTPRIEKLRRGERLVTYRQLRQCLASFRIVLENPHSNTIDVVRIENKPPRLFRRRPQEVKKRLGSIGYRDEGTEVSFRDLKNLREMCKLREQDGVDSDAFYGEADVIDAFVNKYRTVLRRLAKT